MVRFRPGIARCRRLPGRVSGLAMAVGLLVAACGPAQTAATGAPAAHGTAKPSSSASPPPSSTADCASAATCYTPQQLEVAYGVQPLLVRGIDGSGETVVLPELAETQLNPPLVTDLRQDFAAYDRLFHLPAPRLKVVSTFPGPAHPWLAFGEEVLDAEVVHAIAPRANHRHATHARGFGARVSRCRRSPVRPNPCGRRGSRRRSRRARPRARRAHPSVRARVRTRSRP